MHKASVAIIGLGFAIAVVAFVFTAALDEYSIVSDGVWT